MGYARRRPTGGTRFFLVARIPTSRAKDARETGHPGFLSSVGPAPSLSLADFFAPCFEILLHLRHELVGHSAVDEAVVVA